ncbi:alpha/beta fold hydrolase [Polymorphum gilvum]|uniref:Hydrolase, alpha/beta fold family protein n=1 Tax=Polymorphum gilvum (strain LMG 25793 / CGMCC 1.9160 / SL003B-26A1) TaxID=991905 RepID=F2IWJ3_POLGS|nr:alpha/beta hydrolase [Polymorphum gilvum]ADZ69292.1 Hydrolase, alpha/beta fold family protein [Polymorphum gilvum SL003B-26A1]
MIATFLAVLALLAGYTEFRRRRILAAHRPTGSFAEIAGERLHYRFVPPDPGRADLPVLVFLHGASGNLADLELAFLEPLRGRYPMLFVDRPGLGHSERSDPLQAAPAAQARRIAALLEHCGIDRCVAVGHSFGAAVAAALALEEPARVRGLALVAPASHPWPGKVSWYYRFAALPGVGPLLCHTLALPAAELMAPSSLRGVFAPGEPPQGYARAIGLPLVFRPRSFRANACDLAALNDHLAEQAPFYPSLRQPAVVITGDDDRVVWPTIHAAGLKQDLPNVRLIVLEGAGHMPHHTHGQETRTAIAALAEVIARAGQHKTAV